jgi:hypothetical protein
MVTRRHFKDEPPCSSMNILIIYRVENIQEEEETEKQRTE